ncbi:hypothetical protein EII20_14150 [Comamonadaceae bacterium OH2545_COT-014]|nr:hypothetical protein EII20_14150 [Comamonadaceae bacterium OH2545_COT-014]
MYEIGIENKSKYPYEIRLDRAPWVVGFGGVNFHIYVDGKELARPVGIGQSVEKIIIGKMSRISSYVDISYLQSFYSGTDPSRVSIAWSYRLPEDNGKMVCRKEFGGFINIS